MERFRVVLPCLYAYQSTAAIPGSLLIFSRAFTLAHKGETTAELLKDVIKEVPKEVIKYVEVEVPVEVIREVTKEIEVPIEVIVEKKVEKEVARCAAATRDGNLARVATQALRTLEVAEVATALAVAAPQFYIPTSDKKL